MARVQATHRGHKTYPDARLAATARQNLHCAHTFNDTHGLKCADVSGRFNDIPTRSSSNLSAALRGSKRLDRSKKVQDARGFHWEESVS